MVEGKVGARLDFGILGPLEVRCDGAAVTIGGPRQRALLALLLCNSNRVLSRDRLIDELLADRSGHASDGMLRVQVSRLRKALADGAGDEPRLIARPPGYLLRVEPGELDLDTFEALVRDGRAALERDDPERATALLRKAEALWRGRPLADLEFEPFARFEVQRLEELRLLGLEERIDAELALGRHAELCAELATLSSEYPLRERLHGQLMLALYRSGRQADALAVYRRTSRLLREELGLDPSRALRELERSILEQDSSLDTGARGSPAITATQSRVCPFKGLDFFDVCDAELFFGRDRVVADLLALMTESSLVGILGPSGIGKSSLLRAGVLSALAEGKLPGSAGWRQVLLRPGEHPSARLTGALGGEPVDVALAGLAGGERMVIAVDQLEELFTNCDCDDERAAFLDQLLSAVHDAERRAVVVVALRADFYARFASHTRFAEALSRGHVLVGPMDHDELSQAVEQPAARAGLEIERPLVEALVSDAARQTGGLPLLSAMLLELWRARDARTLRFTSYRASGGMQAAVARMAEAAYAGLEAQQRPVARSVMVRLAREQDGALTRRRAPASELEQIEGSHPVIAALTDARLLTISDGHVELSHEALLREWPRYRTWLDDDQIGRRLHAHLTAAAGEWEAHGRDPSDLYRGARLEAAIDWSGPHDNRLNSLEREFLDRSRLEGERHERRQRSQTRRLRSLLLAVGLLGAVAVAAAIVARVKQRSATNEARVALTRQLGAEAVTEPRLDLAMLMAREAAILGRSPQTESSLLATLLRSPAVIGTIALPSNTTAALAFSPDGRTLAAGDGLGNVRLFDARTHALAAAPLGDFSQGQPPAFSGDGKLLAYQTSQCNCGVVTVKDARTLQLVANLSAPGTAPPRPSDIPAGGITIAPGDRTLYYAYWSLDSTGQPAAAYVQRWRLPSGRAFPADRIGSGPLLAMRLVDAGSRLVIVTAHGIEELDAPSLRVVRKSAIGPAPIAPTAAAVSPDGRTVVLGTRTGSVWFANASTGAARSAAGSQGSPVADALYVSSGRAAVTVGSDDEVLIWDLRTGREDDALAGPAGRVAGAAISPDGTTLYTSSLDGLLLEWDLTGDRGLVHRAALGRPASCCASLTPPAPALALSPDDSRFAALVGRSTVGVFSTRTFARLTAFTIKPAGTSLTAVAWSPAGGELAVGGRGGLVQLWSTRGKPRLIRHLTGLHSMFGQPEAVQSLAFSPNGRLVAASDDDKTGSVVGQATYDDFASVAVWQARTGSLVASPNDLNGTLGNGVKPVGDDLLAFSRNGRLLALSLFDRSILILDPATGHVRQVLISASGTTSLAFAPDGTLANGTPAGTVELFNPVTGKEVGSPLLVGAAAVASIAFDPSGRRLATATQGEGIVKLWLLSGLGQLGPGFPTDQGATSAVAFDSEGRLVAADADAEGFAWPTSLAAWELQACTVAGRSMTRAEWRQLGIDAPYSTVCR